MSNKSSSTKKDYELLFKILLIGNTSVGKSSLLLRYVDNQWEETFVPTIGVDFKVKTINIEGKKVKLQIWDTAGQERFKNITSTYYRGAHGILLVYDITDNASFKNLNLWLQEIEKHATDKVYKMLIGNKKDLENKRTISVNQAKDFADAYGMSFIETSAKDNINVDEAFTNICIEIMKSVELDKVGLIHKEKRNINLGGQTTELFTNKPKRGCC